MSQEDILEYLRTTPHNTNVNIVKSMMSNMGSSLPDVTAEDNGKVLTVVNGVWDKSAASGGSGGVTIGVANNLLNITTN